MTKNSNVNDLIDNPKHWMYGMFTLQGTNISHLGKRKILFKMPFLGDMLVPWRVTFGMIWLCFMVNVGKYTIHWASGNVMLINLCNVKWCLSEEIHGGFVHIWQCGSPDELVSVYKNPESDRQYSLHPWSVGKNVNTKKHEQLRYPRVNRINI